ncbi:LysR family transcriptional regulator [Bengtsoniella intestinalis]|uniref:LysR family transcriptional regulator n=1 Tax=Bengtsoniella intestinalis TaxID=3073143 RepID=UPI00391F3084
MNQKEVKYILTIAEEKSITKAAEKLQVSQPALSLFLLRLENSLDVKLFNRNNMGMQLTYQGECYLKMAQKTMKLYRDFQAEICDINSNYVGRLKIGTSAHIGSYVLPEVFPYYQKSFPNMEISIIEGSSEKLESLLSHCDVDIALIHLPLKHDVADYEIISKEKYVVAFSQNHPLEKYMYYKNGEKFPYINPEHLADEKFILSFPYQRVRQVSDQILNKANITRPDILLTTSSVQTALRFAEMGMGVTFLPESYLKLFRCSESPNLCYMEPEYEAYWQFALAYPKKTTLTGPTKAFIEITKDIYVG